ncbi:MAG: arginine N-succinyltransferase [Deltaproteobacteria bacterium]|nr:MAG: arginine N-succinyltransferase [Deltaproteobacteria bacterium]
MHRLREVHRQDLEALYRLARDFDTMNLPADRKALAQIIDRSEASFAERIEDPLRRTYLFGLEDARGRLIGTSMIFAQHGTRDAPHVFFDHYEKEHYSRTLDRYFRHPVVAIRYNYDGPTEVGGLFVSPRRRHRDKPGKQLSFVRFLYMAMHRDRFREEVIAELLPPLLPDGRSRLWEYLGKRFTGLTYQEADKLSRENKEFIYTLFPQDEIYLTLLPKSVRKVVGQVGPDTVPVKRMLERIGFRYAQTIDPFDGGPHYVAKVSELAPVRAYRRLRLGRGPLDPEHAAADATECLVAIERRRGRPRFCAVRTLLASDGKLAYLTDAARERLGARAGTTLHVIPFNYDRGQGGSIDGSRRIQG